MEHCFRDCHSNFDIVSTFSASCLPLLYPPFLFTFSAFAAADSLCSCLLCGKWAPNENVINAGMFFSPPVMMSNFLKRKCELERSCPWINEARRNSSVGKTFGYNLVLYSTLLNEFIHTCDKGNVSIQKTSLHEKVLVMGNYSQVNSDCP